MLKACVAVRAWLCACLQYLHTRTALLWVITQQPVVVSYRRLPLKMGPSVINYSLRNDSEEHSCHLLRGGSLISRKFLWIYNCSRAVAFCLSTVVTMILIIPTESLYLKRI
jgi:hypothetical protein